MISLLNILLGHILYSNFFGMFLMILMFMMNDDARTVNVAVHLMVI